MLNDMLIGGGLSALSTGLGAIPVIFLNKVSHRRMDVLLALTAGVMVAATTFGLIPSALKLGNLFVLSTGLLLGALVLSLLEDYLPHTDPVHSRLDTGLNAKSIMLLAAMALHNIPEGLSVGVSYASQEESLGTTVALSIGLQNAPEGLLIALFLVNQRILRRHAIAIAFLTGTIELAASLSGWYLSALSSHLVPYGLSFAAGAMLFIVYKELIPETHGHGHERAATFSFIIGLLLMLILLVCFDG
ncbi:ZIP family metal transporter [Paenibacillus sp. YYML68]|uniref:ZIP family metal transporter n=1 Tax=Paenibacillus sp. YYML68 TaxID=2909250 RepID=UPI00248FD37A|nr:ZIP family metal transporter [Paenibacillus sp. YYML68]